MNDILVIRGLRSRAWTGIVQVSSATSFADRIASRWALPEPARRAGPARNFRSRHRGSSWLTLSAQVWRPSWPVTLTLSASANWTHSTQHNHHHRSSSHFLKAAYQLTAPEVWASRSRSTSLAWSFFPVTHIWSQATLGKKSVETIHHDVARRFGEFPRFRQNRYVAPRISEPRFSRLRSPTPASTHQASCEMSSQDKDAKDLRAPTLAAAAIASHSVNFQTVAFSTVILSNFSGSLSHSAGLHLMTREFREHTQLRFPASASTVANAAPAHAPGVSKLVLQLRNVTESTYSRPGMQFAEAAPGNQSDLLAGMRSVEKALANMQAGPPPTAPQVPDMQQLTTHVYGQLERQLRIERERRGR
jgi:hypothetical protein